MPLVSLGKFLVAAGVMLVVFGGLLMLGARFGAGQLPGDFALRRGNVSVFMPLATCIILSIILTVILNILARLFR